MQRALKLASPFLAVLMGVVAGLVFPVALAPTPAAAATIALPDMKVDIPTAEISIGQPGFGTRELRFSHVTWNAGAGPWEFRPTYNPATGFASVVQALYTRTGPAQWAFDHTVPVATQMRFVPPDDYEFPLSRFGLYSVAADGSVGTLVAPSPKVDFCMTADIFVGAVPDTPAQTAYPGSNCGNTNLPLGLDVGWGDKYDFTDGGENIDITNVPDGTYWLHAVVDPQGFITESDTSNNTTDTKLTIQGTNVTILQQVHPGNTAPVVTMTSPADGSSVTGVVAVSASVTAQHPVTSVQFLLDGSPLGPLVSTAPYSVNWDTTTAAPGSHTLTAQATDSANATGTAPPVTVNVPQTISGFVIDNTIKTNGSGTLSTPAFSTGAGNELLLAFVSSDGPAGGGQQTATVSGAGLTWSLVKRANTRSGDSEIWKASAANALSGATVTSTPAKAGFKQLLTVVALRNAAGTGATASGGAATGAPSVSYNSTATGSLGFAVGNDWDHATARTVGSGQTLTNQLVDPSSGDTYWVQNRTSVSTGIGQAIALNDTAPTADQWNLAAVEVLPTGGVPIDNPPTGSFVVPAPNATVSGLQTVTVSAADDKGVASVQISLDGQPLGGLLTAAPYTVNWDTTTATNASHQLTALIKDTGGNSASAPPITVTVSNVVPDTTPPTGSVINPANLQVVSGSQPITINASDDKGVASVQVLLDGVAFGAPITTAPYSITWDTTTATNATHQISALIKDTSNNPFTTPAINVTVSNPTPPMVCFIVDAKVFVDGTGTTATTPSFHTAQPNEMLLAFVASDGPSNAKQTLTVSGAGLTWTLLARANTQAGDSEIWKATAANVLANATVTSTEGRGGFHQSLTVIAMQGTDGTGAVAVANGATGAPTASVTTTKPNSLIFGVGNDWSRAVNRTLGPNQVLLHQWADTSTGDTYWAQNTSQQAGPAGSVVVLNDTAPTNERWNLAAVEVIGAAE